MRIPVIVLLATVALLCWTSAALPAVLRVDCEGGGSYLTIQDAVEAAASGDTILVAPCVYEERVVALGKDLTLEGAGAELTELRWSGDLPALEIGDMAWPLDFAISGLTITQEPAEARAVSWFGCRLTLEGCEITGWVDCGPETYPSSPIDATDCGITRVTAGGYGSAIFSAVTRCAIGRATFAGDDTAGPHVLVSEDSWYGVLEHVLGTAHLTNDTVGVLNAVATWAQAEESTFGAIEAEVSRIDLERCLALGDIAIDNEGLYGECGLRFVHSTILGNLSFSQPTLAGFGRVRSTIVAGETDVVGEIVGTVSHNDFVGPATIEIAFPESVYANISADPLFCDPDAADYTLAECSPCAGTAHDGGDMGRYGVGCECYVPVEERSWGRIKAIFR
jgi:hypothetical protein